MIVQYPNELLRKVSEPIVEGEDFSDVLANMREQLDLTDGLGIAAIQTGIPKRLIIVRNIENDVKTVMINPETVAHSQEQVISEEGCLSIGGGKPRCKIKRSKVVTVQYQDLNFETHVQEYSGLMGIVCQHEIAHTEGILIIDELSRLKREMFIKKLSKH